jgi:hypothetical protein
MYIRSYDSRERERLPFSYASPRFSDVSENETRLSPEVINKLTELVFFARHPDLKGKAIKGNRTFEGEWTKIERQLLKPSLLGNSNNVVIDLKLPKAYAEPDYSKTEDELGAWELATVKGNLPFKFATDMTVMRDRKPGSYVSMISLAFDKPQLSISIAKHLRDNAFDQTKAKMDRHAWRQTLALVETHAAVHLRIFRSATQALENSLRELFNRLLPLPTAKKPAGVSKQELDAYMKSLGELLVAIVRLELWQKTCDWEITDYPELSRKIQRAGAVFIPRGLKVKCGPKPDLPAIPTAPV